VINRKTKNLHRQIAQLQKQKNVKMAQKTPKRGPAATPKPIRKRAPTKATKLKAIANCHLYHVIRLAKKPQATPTSPKKTNITMAPPNPKRTRPVQKGTTSRSRDRGMTNQKTIWFCFQSH
jgi:hypothetical protein